MRYLCRLIKTPTGGIVLDPFAGSGTAGVACLYEGCNFILIEKKPEYAAIARRRIAEFTGEETDIPIDLDRQRVTNVQPPLPLAYHKQTEVAEAKK